MMAELNPVPFGRRRGPWKERKHRPVLTTPEGAIKAFAPVHVCNRWGYNEPAAGYVLQYMDANAIAGPPRTLP